MFAFLQALTKFCLNVATTPIKGETCVSESCHSIE
jgi:hypothetical protein